MIHAPVAAKACLWCHNPHESGLPALLRDPAPTVCVQCHEKDLLGPKPPEHLLPDSKCLDCHLGHGGVKKYQLRADVQPGPPPTTVPTGGGGT
jgi:predicted CXXCH cytochrome family protein